MLETTNMKSNFNDTGEVIELLAQQDVFPVSNTSPPNTDDDDHGGYIKAEIVTKATSTPAATIHPIGTGTSKSCLFHSKCNPIDIPNVAWNLSWHDSFYESNDRSSDDVIAVFDFDRSIYDEVPTPISNIALVLTVITIVALYFSVMGNFWISIAIWCSCLMGICRNDSDRRKDEFLIKRTHIAISHNGIYIDQVDEPGSHILMVRNIIYYSDIEKCKVTTEFKVESNTMKYNVFLHLKDEHDPDRLFSGIIRPQLFVDVVNAMIEQRTDPTTTKTTASCYDSIHKLK